MTNSRLTNYLSLLLLFFLTLIYLYPLVLHPYSVQNGYDLISYYYPYWLYIKDCYNKYDEIPLWNSSILCGTTIIGNAHFSFFYPFNWLFLILPLPIAFNFWFIIHIFIAGAGCYFLLVRLKICRLASLYGAIIYMFGAHFASRINIGHYDHISTISWIPITFLFLYRLITNITLKNTLLFGLFLGIQLITLHLQLIYYIVLSFAIYTLTFVLLEKKLKEKRNIPFFKLFSSIMVSGVISVTLASGQLLYIVQAVICSNRVGRSYEIFSKLSLPPQQILGFFIPDLWGSGTRYVGGMNFWELSTFIGFSVLIPLFYSFKVKNNALRSLQITGLIALFFAMGKYTPLGKVLYYLPFMSFSRVPARFLIITIFSIAVTAAFGINNMLETLSEDKLRTWFKKVTFALTLILLICWILFFLNDASVFKKILYPPDVNSGTNLNINLSTAFIKISIVIAFLWFFYLLVKNRQLKFRYVSIFLIILCAVELIHYNLTMISPIKEREIQSGLEELMKLEHKSESIYRFWGGRYIDQAIFLKAGLQKADGYEALIDNDYFMITYALQKKIQITKKEFTNYRLKLVRMLNVKYMFHNKFYNLSTYNWETNKQLTIKNNEYWIYKCNDYLPRAYFASSSYIGENLKEFYEFIRGQHFKTSVFSESQISNNEGQLKEAVISKYEPNRVSILCQNNTKGILVLSDLHFPGWNVYVNGKKSKIIKANYVFRGVILQPGNNIVEFRYEPVLLNIGKTISLFSLIALIVSLYYMKKRKKLCKLIYN